ncbi:recombination and repair protein RecT [Caballeronia catudaia]|uniref:Recombination and repair protein RecT n=1 Tax=Caballeronia catudaia TaxID=1777136 RepID=A0A158D006_9BURK|nr:recombination and repair protein RecT [Caballeronia catudaia]
MVYAFARLVNGGFYFEAMEWAEIEYFRNMSKAKADDTPWSKWPEEMAKVRPLKRLCKRLPMTTKARAALARDDARDSVLFDATPDDPLQAINRTIREGRTAPTANSPAALTNDPSPTLDLNIAPRTAERVARRPAADAAQAKPPDTSQVAPTVEREPTLEEVLERIDVARNADDLAAAGALAAQMRSEGAKKIARDAYSQKSVALRNAASEAVLPAESHEQRLDRQYSYAEVRDRIEHAQSLEELDDAIDLIDAVFPREHSDELRDIAHARREGFTQ